MLLTENIMTTLRIATWNLNRPFYKKSGYIRDGLKIALQRYAKSADILVLTETDIQLKPEGYTVAAESRYTSVDGHEETERWVSIWIKTNSNCVFIEKIDTIDVERTSCARVSVQEMSVLIYGTVLPWQSDKWHGFDETRAFRAALMLQSAEWRYLKDKYSLPMIVAGDFNQDLWNEHYYGNAKNKELLKNLLDWCDLDWGKGEDPVAKITLKENRACINEDEQHASIDHICISEHFNIVNKECWPRTDVSGKQLTDHFGSLLDVELINS